MPDPTVNPQPENTSVIFTARTTQAQANEAIAQSETRANGAQAGVPQTPTNNAPQLVDASQILKMAGEGKARVINIDNIAGEREALAVLFENANLHAQAAALRPGSGAVDPSLTGMVKRTWRRKIEVSDVAVFAIGVTVLVLVYEGIAYKFDWPRYGVWGPANPLKALKK